MPEKEYTGSPYFQAKAEMEISQLRARDKKSLAEQVDSPDQSNPNPNPTKRQIEEHLRNLKNPRK